MKTKGQIMTEMLNQAIASNNLKRAEELIKIGATTADLRECVQNNLREMAGLLLQQDFSINTDILHWIVKNRYIELIEPALKKNPNGAYRRLQYKTTNGNSNHGTPLDCAIENDDMEIAKLLVKHGVLVDKQHSKHHQIDITKKAISGDIEWVEFFIDSGADLKEGLRYAILGDKRDIIELFLKKGVDIKKSEIWSAVTTKDMGEFLVSLGADVHEKDGYNRSALHSIYNKDLDLIKFLIDSGVDVNSKDNSGHSPLHNLYREDIAELLIQAGADVNLKDNGGMTPLHYITAVSESKNMIKFLIKKGADVNAKANDGRTILHLFAHHSSAKSLIELLIKHGADVNIKDNAGMTPLHISASRDFFSNSRIFIDAGADLFTIDKNGKTPEGRTGWTANSRKINNYMKNVLINLSPEEFERRKEKALEEYNTMMGNVIKTEEEFIKEIEQMISALYENES